MNARWYLSLAAALVRHPSLWFTALRQAGRLAPSGWWRRPPFLPLPDERYLGFRLQTMYGHEVDKADPNDAVTYLRWCREFS